MDFYEKLRSFFGRFLGLPRSEESGSQEYHQRRNFPEHPRNDAPDFGHFLQPGRGFNIFTDPLEMHQYFEQQVNDMLRMFGFGQGFGENFASGMWGAIEDDGEHPDSDLPTGGGDLRDQYLKPGYEEPDRGLSSDKKDQDVDGRLDMRDLDSIFRGRSSIVPRQNPSVVPYQESRSFGKSMTSSTIYHPDGSVEIRKTVRDSQGNEETTITYKLADKEYTIIKKRDRTGKEEIVENFVNMDKDEVNKYFPKLGTSSPDFSDGPPIRWSLFNNFF